MGGDERKLRAVFAEALEKKTPAERAAYLDEACAGDDDLRQRVEDLLKAHEEAGSFLGGDANVDEDEDSAREPPGTEIGPYRLVEEIGEGGFGIVYVAEQTSPVRRRVALKLVKPGMDTREVLLRFEAERQALAFMDHPGIARVFDGGSTPGGRPYFVMELVKGVSIHEYCDECRLPLRERLELFVQVCRAVQHAHQKGVIHRDLKPSNVLVARQDGRAAPKVIDFGVAKATGRRLTEQTFHTRFAQIIGTPQYMSPEQAELSALDVDTRSDIYSLGVLLYELLTGTTPFTSERLKDASFDELRRIIREEEPPTPSARLKTMGGKSAEIAAVRRTDPRRLAQVVRGDLDWIVMKALEKDPRRRYETANGLAREIERYLADEPVEARPPSRWYRLRKLARRHRPAVAIAAVVLFFLLLLGGAAGWVARDRAARQAALERQVADALAEAESRYGEGRIRSAMAAVQRAQGLVRGGLENEGLERRVRRWQQDLEMLARLEEVRLGMASVRSGHFDFSRADPGYREAFRWYGVDVDALSAEEAAARIGMSAVKNQLVAALDDWLASKKEDDAYVHRLVESTDSDPWRRRLREGGDIDALRGLARSPDAVAQEPATLMLLARGLARNGDAALAVEILREAQQRHPDDFWINHGLAHTLMRLDPPRTDEAVEFFRAAVALRHRSPGVHLNLGHALHARGDRRGAEAQYREAIRLRQDYAMAYYNLGNVLRESNRFDDAISAYQEAIRLEPDDHDALIGLGRAHEARHDLDGAIDAFNRAIKLVPAHAHARFHLGNVLHQQGDPEGAVQAYRRAIELEPGLARAHYSLGNVLREQRRLDEAASAYRDAVHADPRHAQAHYNLGIVLTDLNELDGAIDAYKKAIELKPRFVAMAYNNLGFVFARKRQGAKAMEAYRAAIRADSGLAEAHDNLGNALSVCRRFEEAIKEYGKAIASRPDWAAPHFHLGNAYLNQDKLDEAMAAYGDAVKKDPKFAWAYNSLGHIHMRRGDFAKAVEAFREAIRADPKYATAHFNLGIAFTAQNRLDDAIKAYREVIKLRPKHRMAHLNQGAVFVRKGELEDAIDALKKAVECAPRFVRAHVGLAHAYLAAGRPADAIKQWSKALELRPKNVPVLNALAWTLATVPDVSLRDPARAVELATKAVGIAPGSGGLWNTLGVARYRAGKIEAAIEALGKSMELRKGGDAYDWFFLAMAHARLGRKDEAMKWYGKAAEWTKAQPSQDAELLRFRAEAEELLESGSSESGPR